MKNPDLSTLIFGLSEFSFNEVLVSFHYPKENMMKQQKSSLQENHMKRTTFCIIGYYICVPHEGTICENLSLVLYLYADFVTE